jgi:hypothetical protein
MNVGVSMLHVSGCVNPAACIFFAPAWILALVAARSCSSHAICWSLMNAVLKLSSEHRPMKCTQPRSHDEYRFVPEGVEWNSDRDDSRAESAATGDSTLSSLNTPCSAHASRPGAGEEPRPGWKKRDL